MSPLGKRITQASGGPIRVEDGHAFALGMVESLTGMACSAVNRGATVMVRGSGVTPDTEWRCINDPVTGYEWRSIRRGSAWSVLTNGDPMAPEVVFDSDGDVIMTETLR